MPWATPPQLSLASISAQRGDAAPLVLSGLNLKRKAFRCSWQMLCREATEVLSNRQDPEFINEGGFENCFIIIIKATWQLCPSSEVECSLLVK